MNVTYEHSQIVLRSYQLESKIHFEDKRKSCVTDKHIVWNATPVPFG